MTRKDYIMLVHTIVNSRVYNSDKFPEFKKQLIAMLSLDNPRFEIDKFEDYLTQKIIDEQNI